MAFSDLGTIGSANNKTAANSLSFNTTQALSVGDLVTVQVATDNQSNTTGATTTHSSVSCGSNSFTKVSERTIGGGGAASGATLSLWHCVITSAVSSGTALTANFSFSPAAKCMSGRRFSVGSGSTLSYSAAQVNNANGAPASLTVSGLDASKQHMAQRAAALESTSTSISTETTGWTLGTDVGTSGGGSATNMSTRSEYLIASQASFTSAPGGTSGDGVSIMFVVTETPPAPSWNSSTTANVAENTTLSYTMDASNTSSYSIVGGADQTKFEISGTTLRWASNGTKDYESPDDADTNNTYVVTLRATGAGGTADRTVTVTVTDVTELVALSWGSGGSVAENSANSTAVGTVAGKTSGSSLSLQDDAGGRFAINGSTGAVTVANGTLLDYETNTSHNITVRETLASASNSPRDTILSVTITDVTEGGGSLWTPSDLATDPVHWFDAQDSGSLTIDGSTNVQQWNDKGTAAANAAQSTAANRPAYVASSNINSLPAVRSSNANNIGLDLTASWPIRHFQNGFTVNTDLTIDFSSTEFVNSNSFDTLTSPTVIGVVWTAGTGNGTMEWFENGLSQQSTTTGTFTTTGALFFVSDLASAGGGPGGGGGGGRFIGNFNKLFNRSDGARPLDGDVGEIIYLNYAPSQSQREYIEGYLAHRWDNEAALPVAHPFKSSAPTTGGATRRPYGYAFILQ